MNTSKQHLQTAVVFDDHELFASAFSMILERSGMFETVLYFSDHRELERFILQKSLSNTWFFVDYLLQDGNTSHLISDIHRFCASPTIVIVSSLINPLLIERIISYKIHGFVGKFDTYSEVFTCINQINANRNIIYLSSEIKSILINSRKKGDINMAVFTAREMEIIELISKGRSPEDISAELSISPATIVTHRRNILKKSGMGSFAKLIILLNSENNP